MKETARYPGILPSALAIIDSLEARAVAAEAERDALRIQVQDLLGNEAQNVELQKDMDALRTQNGWLRKVLEDIRQHADCEFAKSAAKTVLALVQP